MKADISLRPMEQADLPAFFEHQNEPEANRMSASCARSREDFMAHAAKTRANPAVDQRTILYDGRVAGYVASFERLGHREVCYWLGKDFWGKGVATAALASFLKTEERRPLWARVAKRNAGSIRVLEKCGFTTIGEETYSNREGEQVEEFIMELK